MLQVGAGWGLGGAGGHWAEPASSPGQVLDQVLIKSGYTLLGESGWGLATPSNAGWHLQAPLVRFLDRILVHSD